MTMTNQHQAIAATQTTLAASRTWRCHSGRQGRDRKVCGSYTCTDGSFLVWWLRECRRTRPAAAARSPYAARPFAPHERPEGRLVFACQGGEELQAQGEKPVAVGGVFDEGVQIAVALLTQVVFGALEH